MSQSEVKTHLGPNTDSAIGSIHREGIVGTWFNTNRTVHEIAKIELTSTADNWLIRAYGHEDDTTNDWGEVPVAPHVTPDRPHEMIGFEAHFESEAIGRHLAANLKYGVLVIQCYKHVRGTDQDGSYFTREFFHQRLDDFSEPDRGVVDDNALPSVKASDCLDNTADALDAGADLTPYLGIWRNTHRHTRGISHLELLSDGDEVLVHAHGVAAQRDWGAVSALAYSEGVSSRDPSGFFAKYEFEFLEMQLAANFNKGLLIVAAYSRFKDGSGRADYFTREFFYHERPFK